MQPLLLACMIVLLAHAQGQGSFNGSMVVKDVNKDCPISNTLYAEDELNASKLLSWMNPGASEGSQNSSCAGAVSSLAECAMDGSLQVKEGCCSAACAAKMQQALVNSGRQCYRQFTEVVCNSTEARVSFAGVLFGAVERCLGLHPSCELLSQSGDLLNTTHSNGIASTATGSGPQQEQQHVKQDSKSMEGAAATGGSGGSSSSSSSSANVGNSVGMQELAAALAAQEAAPYMAPDSSMPLVPRPVETAASAVVLATPEEIAEAARRNG